MQKHLNIDYRNIHLMEQSTGPPKELKKIDEVTWELPKSYKEGMNVPARIIANKEHIEAMDGGVFEQISNVATLPGIQKYAYCMPDGQILCS